MLTIRKDQKKAFELQKLKDFEDQMVKHIEEFAPQQFRVTGESAVREIIQVGITRAESYGFTNRGPLQFYLEMMFMFGSDFDTDPQYPWIREILEKGSVKDQMERADDLYEKVMEFRDKVLGANYVYEKAAMEKFVQIPFEVFKKVNFEDVDAYRKMVVEIYPEKLGFMDKSSILNLYNHANLIARKFDISSHGGIAMTFSLMFALGHGCFTDLQFAWIKKTVDDHVGSEASLRSQKLYEKMMVYFEKALSLFNLN